MTDHALSSCVGSAPWLVCHDLKTTVEYYREVLGFVDEWQWEWGDPPDHAGLSRGRCRILFVEDPETAPRSRGRQVVLYVEGVEAMYDELCESGAVVIHDLGVRPWGTRDFTVEDPNGVELIYTEAPDEWLAPETSQPH